jgi:DNA-binding XRE family transcriptional regulator
MTGLEFKKYRKKLSVSQEIMGKSLFVSKRTIINYEKSEKVPVGKVKLMHSIYSNDLVNNNNNFSDLKIEDKLNKIFKVLKSIQNQINDTVEQAANNEVRISQTNRLLFEQSMNIQEALEELKTESDAIKNSN